MTNVIQPSSLPAISYGSRRAINASNGVCGRPSLYLASWKRHELLVRSDFGGIRVCFANSGIVFCCNITNREAGKAYVGTRVGICHSFFFFHHFCFPAHLAGGFTLCALHLDKPWSQVSSFLPTAPRISSNVANSRSRAFRLSVLLMQDKIPASICTR